MTQWDKLIQQLLSLPNDMRYEDLERILRSYGYEPKETAGGSSHVTFRRRGRTPITIPRHGRIKRTYIRVIRDAILREENEDDRDDGE